MDKDCLNSKGDRVEEISGRRIREMQLVTKIYSTKNGVGKKVLSPISEIDFRKSFDRYPKKGYYQEGVDFLRLTICNMYDLYLFKQKLIHYKKLVRANKIGRKHMADWVSFCKHWQYFDASGKIKFKQLPKEPVEPKAKNYSDMKTKDFDYHLFFKEYPNPVCYLAGVSALCNIVTNEKEYIIFGNAFINYKKWIKATGKSIREIMPWPVFCRNYKSWKEQCVPVKRQVSNEIRL